MKLRDLPSELERRGNDKLKDFYWVPNEMNANFWTGVIFGLLTGKEQWITPSEALGFCLELEAAGAGDTVWFKQLKKIAYEKSKE